jgi:hypothetical protein
MNKIQPLVYIQSDPNFGATTIRPQPGGQQNIIQKMSAYLGNLTKSVFNSAQYGTDQTIGYAKALGDSINRTLSGVKDIANTVGTVATIPAMFGNEGAKELVRDTYDMTQRAQSLKGDIQAASQQLKSRDVQTYLADTQRKIGTSPRPVVTTPPKKGEDKKKKVKMGQAKYKTTRRK